MAKWSDIFGCYLYIYRDPNTGKCTTEHCKNLDEVEAFRKKLAEKEPGQMRLPYAD